VDALFSVLCRGGYYQLQQLRPVTRSLLMAATERVVHTCIVNRLDYCNSLVTTVWCGYASPTFSQERRRATCNWCLALWSHNTNLVAMWQRVPYKIAVLVFHCLASQAPSYLANNCPLVSDVCPCRLCSSDSMMYVTLDAHGTLIAIGGLPPLDRCSGILYWSNCNNVTLTTFRDLFLWIWDHGALWL